MSELSTLESELVVATDSEDYEMVRTKLCTFHGDPYFLFCSVLFCCGNAIIVEKLFCYVLTRDSTLFIPLLIILFINCVG